MGGTDPRRMGTAGSASGGNASGDPGGRRELDEELEGLDLLELPAARKAPLSTRIWRSTWPKLAAITIAVGIWQVAVWLKWRPTYVLPPPAEVAEYLRSNAFSAEMLKAVAVTMQRAAFGYLLALLIGGVVGIGIYRSRLLRSAVGSLITGLQSMPSIAWFPLAILFFQLSEAAILFVVVLGAAPSIANGIVGGIDHIPPIQLRAANLLGLKGFKLYRHVIIPSALPGVIGGLKQAWAFAWRSLMAGELIVVIANRPSIGAKLQFAREVSDAVGLVSVMVMILVIGVLIDTLVFGAADKAIRRRRGLLLDEADN